MAIKVKCGKCGRGWAVKEEYAGRKMRCKGCGAVVPIPALPPAREAKPEPGAAIMVSCPGCGAQYECEPGDLGGVAECETCGKEFTLERPSPAGPASAQTPTAAPAPGKDPAEPEAAPRERPTAEIPLAAPALEDVPDTRAPEPAPPPPAPAEPPAAEAALVEAAFAEPAPSRPAPAEPAPAQPAATGPGLDDEATVMRAPAEPPAVEPASPEPTPAEPAAAGEPPAEPPPAGAPPAEPAPPEAPPTEAFPAAGAPAADPEGKRERPGRLKDGKTKRRKTSKAAEAVEAEGEAGGGAQPAAAARAAEPPSKPVPVGRKGKSRLPLVAAGCTGLFLVLAAVAAIVVFVVDPFGLRKGDSGSGASSSSGSGESSMPGPGDSEKKTSPGDTETKADTKRETPGEGPSEKKAEPPDENPPENKSEPPENPVEPGGGQGTDWAKVLKESGDPAERAKAAGALGTVAREGRAGEGGPTEAARGALEALKGALADADASVRAAVAAALGDSGDPGAVRPLVEARGGEADAGAREAMARALVAIGRDGIPELLPFLEDARDEAVETASAVLGELQDASAVEMLIAALKRGAAGRHAARALGAIGDAKAADPLVEALGSPEKGVRAEAAAALGRVGGDPAVSPLIEALKDEAAEVRSAAAGSLRKITGQDFGESYEKWKEWKEPAANPEAAQRKQRYQELSAQAAEEEKREGGDPAKALELWKEALSFADAEEDRSAAQARIEALSAAIEKRVALARALERGRTALEAGKLDEARAAFEEALGLDPEAAEAGDGLKKIEAVRGRAAALEEGRKAEEAGDWRAAAAAYARALEADPGDADTRARLDGVRDRLYRDAFAEGEKAVQAKDWKTAKAAFLRALEAKPGDPEAAKLLRRAENAPVVAILSAHFEIPRGDKDPRGNPVTLRDGSRSDRAVGLPCEIWLRKPAMQFVLVPPGEFLMGSPESEPGRKESEGPVRKVRIERPFYIAKYELTRTQWVEIMGSDLREIPNPDWPADGRPWTRVKEFVGQVNAGAAAAGPALEFRLPSEAEWEYACRAGTEAAFVLGAATEDLSRAAWWLENAGGSLHPVGQKAPNAWGLYDGLGNAAEWCEDPSHPSFEGAPADGAVWTAGGDAGKRVARGGSYEDGDGRVARRSFRDETTPERGIGIRLVVWPKLGD